MPLKYHEVGDSEFSNFGGCGCSLMFDEHSLMWYHFKACLTLGKDGP